MISHSTLRSIQSILQLPHTNPILPLPHLMRPLSLPMPNLPQPFTTLTTARTNRIPFLIILNLNPRIPQMHLIRRRRHPKRRPTTRPRLRRRELKTDERAFAVGFGEEGCVATGPCWAYGGWKGAEELSRQQWFKTGDYGDEMQGHTVKS